MRNMVENDSTSGDDIPYKLSVEKKFWIGHLKTSTHFLGGKKTHSIVRVATTNYMRVVQLAWKSSLAFQQSPMY